MSEGIPKLSVDPAGPTVPRRVLVVDDHVAIAMMTAQVLRELGDHAVSVAHDGPSALEAARLQQPEIVLLDIGLPQMDGYEVARRLRGQPESASVLIVALTGYGTEEDRRLALAAGCDSHLAKPASLEDLIEIFYHPKLATA